jgi:low temperature requirement protein LtrA
LNSRLGPPRPHGQQPRERVVGPLELFYDLAVVVLVAQDADQLALDLSSRGLAEFAVVFTLLWFAWLNGSLHHELHGREDARGRSIFLVQVLVLATMGAVGLVAVVVGFGAWWTYFDFAGQRQPRSETTASLR